MIDQDKRKAIYLLHSEGMGIRAIARQFRVNRNTVRDIIKQGGLSPQTTRQDKIQIDPELLTELYGKCSGRVQRIHEKLTEEEGISIGYSTLTRMVRELELGRTKKDRCSKVADEPGEMQHDTTPYTIAIDGRKTRLVASIIYFRYSKMRYLKFYRFFNRFNMKCFLHEALTFYGYSGTTCIIDNTNLARLRGTGKDAVINPEMEKFAGQFGFCFVCHAKGHANRKAGNERSFYTVETNFFPGRLFESLEDLNSQAFEWATVRMANRPVSKTRLIPAKVFEYEKSFLVKVPPYIPPPYLVLTRDIDQYGYVSFDGNFYWVPGCARGEAKVLQYSKTLKVYQARKLLGEYSLPAYGEKNEAFTPDGLPRPVYKPNNRRRPTEQEEKRLRAVAEVVDTYLTFVLKDKGNKYKYNLIRQLFGLYKKITPSLFTKTIERALKYRITDMNCVERIALLQMTDGDLEIAPIEIDEQFQERQTYQEGRLSDEVDLSIYDKIMEDDTDDG